ncbi:hypothetical protein GCM10023340_04640 [Nocardioides marinquilinus]|uniref:DUF559 domain-containing protein n=1 Tax=Nocardioides marinquilinus TaxID=1210400 RepID=A0ABP9P861_9ACTN
MTPDLSLAPSAVHPHLSGPFTRRELIAAGGTAATLRRGDYRQVLPRVWMHTSALDDLALVRAALHIHPADAVASHMSAALVLGLPVPDQPFAHVTVFRHRDRRFRREIKPHVTERRRRVIRRRGLRVTDPVATFIDCAGWLSLVDMVILGDALAKRYDIDPARLVQMCEASTDYYRGRALAAALLVRTGVDTPMETRLRLLIVLAGLPEPVINHRVYWDDGTLKRRFDLYYPEVKVIVEYDGRQHAEDTAQWRGDLERREELDDDGYRILVVTATGVFREPAHTLHRIRRLLIARGMEGVAELDDEWRHHFAA